MSDFEIERRSVLASALLAVGALGRDSVSMPQSTQNGRQHCYIEEFGAKGDGRSDDTYAFERAISTLAPGSVIHLRGGGAYRLTRSLIFTRPLSIEGGAKEDTRLLFDNGAYARLGGATAALIFPHERSKISNSRATARRSTLKGISILWTGSASAKIHGCLIAAPVYFYEVDIGSFALDGFRIEAESPEISGNANGSAFFNCSARSNGQNGFAFVGNDANACVLVGARAFDNGKIGFYDASLLGNTYVGAEADGNRRGGYTSIKTTPNRSVFLGCYAEPNQRYDLNGRNIVLGAIGHLSGVGGAMLRALPSGDLFLAGGQVFAGSEEAARPGVLGSAYLRTAAEGIDLYYGDDHRLRLTKLLSPNYIDILNGDTPVIRFPIGGVTGNISGERPWLPSGFALGRSGKSGLLGSGARPPQQGRYEIGAIWLNEAPRAGAYVGWVCTASGYPGTWHPFGKIE